MNESSVSALDSRPVVVGISNPNSTAALVELAASLAEPNGAPLLAVRVVTVPQQMSLSSARGSAEVSEAASMLRGAIDRAEQRGIPADGVVEIARSVEDGLSAVMHSRDAGLLVLGWSEATPPDADEDEDEGNPSTAQSERAFERLMYRVDRAVEADVLFAKFRSADRRHVLVPISQSRHLPLVARTTRALAQAEPGTASSMRFVHVCDPTTAQERSRIETQALLAAHGLADMGELDVLVADDAEATIVAMAADADIVIIGATTRAAFAEPFARRVESMAEGAACSLLVARAGRQ